ncbi:MAG: hypothetical protein KKF33_02205 [Alphaproteobacteria bacterium]|jgi:hypothetical protein|nr:hypothetical protein [Alphaproteobacteria bacterium]
MIGWFKKFVAPAATTRQAVSQRPMAPENCALWRDVARALDAKPKGSSK